MSRIGLPAPRTVNARSKREVACRTCDAEKRDHIRADQLHQLLSNSITKGMCPDKTVALTLRKLTCQYSLPITAMPTYAQKLQIVDSHTGGEPTRVVVSGGPDLGNGSIAQRRDRMRSEFDRYRSAIVNEPRGSDVMVGALLCEPVDADCVAAAIYFNNVGYLGMCGHGTIGLLVTLAHLGRIGIGEHRIETPVGIIQARLESPNAVSVRNVSSYRYAQSVSVEVENLGTITGDIAWGGNWFFLVENHGLRIAADNLPALTTATQRIRTALRNANITGVDGAEIDHIELFAKSPTVAIDARNFVLCPGDAYDRSPCGTGTSAKLACLFADGKIRPGQIWRQESVIGSVFEASIELSDDRIYPRIAGQAHICAEGTLLIDSDDPFAWGIRI